MQGSFSGSNHRGLAHSKLREFRIHTTGIGLHSIPPLHVWNFISLHYAWNYTFFWSIKAKLESLERSGVLLCYDDINGGRIFGIVVYDRGSGSSQWQDCCLLGERLLPLVLCGCDDMGSHEDLEWLPFFYLPAAALTYTSKKSPWMFLIRLSSYKSINTNHLSFYFGILVISWISCLQTSVLLIFLWIGKAQHLLCAICNLYVLI